MSQKVLLVDHESSFRLMSQRFLKTKGLEVSVAINGLDAIHKIKQSFFDVIVVKADMPVMGGLGMITQLTEMESWGSFRVILLLEEGDRDTAGIQSELIQTLEKPFSLEKLYTRIHNTCGTETTEAIEELIDEEDVLLSSEDDVYYGMMKEILAENFCLSRLIHFTHHAENETMLDALAQQFYSLIQETLKSKVRIWMIQDSNLKVLAEHPDFPPLSPHSPTYQKILDTFETQQVHQTEDVHLFYEKQFVLEVLESPQRAESKHIFELLILFLKNFIPVFHSFRDRAYFRRFREQFEYAEELKEMIVQNLEEIRKDITQVSDQIGNDMDSLLFQLDQIDKDDDLLLEIETIAVNTMNVMQNSDINNQRLYRIMGHLKNLFTAVQESLDTKDDFFTSTDRIDLEAVSSQSILDQKKQSSQSNVNDLLADFGL